MPLSMWQPPCVDQIWAIPLLLVCRLRFASAQRCSVSGGITPVHQFVYAILFKSLCLLRLHLMQASVLPSLVAFITFGCHPDNGSMRSAASIYAWHIYMPSPCFSLNFVLFCAYFVFFIVSICIFQFFLLSLQAE